MSIESVRRRAARCARRRVYQRARRRSPAVRALRSDVAARLLRSRGCDDAGYPQLSIGARLRARNRMSTIEVKVPDIGDFTDVPVIDVFVKPGDTVKPEDPLITLESDKATMDVPSPNAGVIKDVKLKVGDKVSEGSVILTLETQAATTAPKPAPAGREGAAAPPPAARPAKEVPGIKSDVECEMMVLGSGPGGYSAAFRSAD